MPNKLYFRGKHIATNGMLYKLTLELVDRPEDFKEWLDVYTETNTHSAKNILFQVGYQGNDEEVKKVRNAIENAGYSV